VIPNDRGGDAAPASGGAQTTQAPAADASIQTGNNEAFENRFWRFQRFAWAVLTLFVAAGLAGAFGRGPLSAGSATTSNQSRVEYERLLRFKTPTSYRLTLKPDATTGADEMRVRVDAALLSKLKLSQMVPAPKSAEAHAGGIVLVYPVGPVREPFGVELTLEPKSVGRVRGRLGIAGSDPVGIHHFVFP